MPSKSPSFAIALGCVVSLSFSATVAADDIHGSDCSLCKAVATGSAFIVPAEGTEAPAKVYRANLAAATNCLDIRILGASRSFTPFSTHSEILLSTVPDWAYATAQSGEAECEDCLETNRKVRLLFNLMFGDVGEGATLLASHDQAALTCRALFQDAHGALAAVAAAGN